MISRKYYFGLFNVNTISVYFIPVGFTKKIKSNKKYYLCRNAARNV